MTPGGGRGWFHRRRSQPADPPAPETSSALKPPADPDPIAEAPARLALRLTIRRCAPTQSDAPLEPAVTLARSAAPPQEPGDPFQQRVEPVLSAGEVAQQQPGGPPVGEIRPTAGIDWDAETAAALSGDGEAMHHSSGPTALDAHAAPDQLLEDLIREIVGDAAVDTASSLHAPRPIMGTEAPLPPTPAGAESPHTDPGHDALRSEVSGSDLPSSSAPASSAPSSSAPHSDAPISDMRSPDLPSSEGPNREEPNSEEPSFVPLGREATRREAPHATVTSASVDEYRPSTSAFRPPAPATTHEQSQPAASLPPTSQEVDSPSAASSAGHGRAAHAHSRRG